MLANRQIGKRKQVGRGGGIGAFFHSFFTEKGWGSMPTIFHDIFSCTESTYYIILKSMPGHIS